MSTKGQFYKHDEAIPIEKVCPCGETFMKKPKETWNDFKKKKFCSYSCYWDNKEQPVWLNRGGGYHKGHKHSEETRIKLSAVNQGISIEKWNGFIEDKKDKLRKTSEYKLWRKSVLERDGGVCQECGAQNKVMHADHILPFAYFPDSRLDINNGRTLCEPCHKATPTWGGKIKNYREKITF